MASYLHYSGVKLETISMILGHSQEETIEFYVFASKEKAKKVPDLFKYI
jgi:site-specific recombinase XerD